MIDLKKKNVPIKRKFKEKAENIRITSTQKPMFALDMSMNTHYSD